MLTETKLKMAIVLTVFTLFIVAYPATRAIVTIPLRVDSPDPKSLPFDSAVATAGTGLNQNPVSVSMNVVGGELLIAGLTYSTFGGGIANNSIASILDTQGLRWTHILNSGVPGGDKGLDLYYAIASSRGKDTVTLTPASITYKTGFLSAWAASAVDLTHAVQACNLGVANSISTTLTTGGNATIATFSADDGKINVATGPGTFHFDFYDTSRNGVSVNVDDVKVTSPGTFSYNWAWSASATACTVAVPIGAKILPVPGTPLDVAAGAGGTGLNAAPVSVSLAVRSGELLVGGMTYSTAGSVTPNNGVAAITDTQGLTWNHILNSGITGGEKGVDVYYAIAALNGTEVVTFAPFSTTYKSGFVSSWGTNYTIVDVSHAVATCDPGFASSITTTLSTSGSAAIGAFSASDGQISSGSGPGSFHFDFFRTGVNFVSVNVDDVVESSAGTYTDTWSWAGSTTACTVAVPISNHAIVAVGTPFVSAAATGGTGFNSDPVSVSLPVNAGQLLLAGMTYSTAGGGAAFNSISLIQDSQRLNWTHVLTPGVQGGDKSVDLYFAIAVVSSTETVTFTPASTTYKSGFVSAWSVPAVDLTHAVSACNSGFASSISTTLTTGGNMTIALFSADDGRINAGAGPGSFHFDFFDTGPNHVSVNVDDVVVASPGTFAYAWNWSASTTACAVAVPIGTKITPVAGTILDMAAATGGSGLNSNPVSVSLPVKAGELLLAGLTYSTAGSVSPNNGVASITDTQGLTWTHVLNSTISGGDKGVDVYYAVAKTTGTETLIISPIATTYKSGFLSSWAASTIDVLRATATCAAGFSNSITTSTSTTGAATIAAFTASDGQIMSGSGQGSFHFDFYRTGVYFLSINVDDVAVQSAGTYTDTWSWQGSTAACTVAVPIS